MPEQSTLLVHSTNRVLQNQTLTPPPHHGAKVLTKLAPQGGVAVARAKPKGHQYPCNQVSITLSIPQWTTMTLPFSIPSSHPHPSPTTPASSSHRLFQVAVAPSTTGLRRSH